MYTKAFGLKKRPFILSPDPDFLYLSRGHDLALTHLEYGLMHNVGFLALTGEIGAGKTTLLKYLFDKAQHGSLDIAMVFNTFLDPKSLLEMLAKEFNLTPASTSKTDLVDALFNHFLEQYSKKQRCVIVVDEAQNLPIESFEELRMLSNLEVGTDFLVQIVLVGQPQLRERLSHPSLAQLRQRISTHYHLSPLSIDEVGNYVEHRLNLAGYDRPDPLFDVDALRRIGEVSQGIPRLINSICDACLTYAYGEERDQVALDTVERVLADNELLCPAAEPGGCDGAGACAGNGAATHAGYPAGGAYAPGDSARPSGGSASPPSSLPHASAHAAFTDMHFVLSSFTTRLEAMEGRIRMMESCEEGRGRQVLQEMLEKERDRTLRCMRKIASLTKANKSLEAELQELKRQSITEVSAVEARVSEESLKPRESREPRRLWRIFGSAKH